MAIDLTDFLPIIAGTGGGIAGSFVPGVGTAAGATIGTGVGTAIQAGLALRESPDVPDVPAEMKNVLGYEMNLMDEYSSFTGASPTMTQNVYQREREQGSTEQQIENTLMDGGLDMLGRARALKYILQKTESMREDVEQDLLAVDLQSESARLEGGSRAAKSAGRTSANIANYRMMRYNKIQEYKKRQAALFGEISGALSTVASEVGNAMGDGDDQPTTDEQVAGDSGILAATEQSGYDALTTDIEDDETYDVLDDIERIDDPLQSLYSGETDTDNRDEQVAGDSGILAAIGDSGYDEATENEEYLKDILMLTR